MSRNSRCKLSQQVCSESDLLDLYDEEERASGGKLKAIEKTGQNVTTGLHCVSQRGKVLLTHCRGSICRPRHLLLC